MLIDHYQTKVGDEVIAAVSGLDFIYLKVLKKNESSFTCSVFKYPNGIPTYETDVSKHNSKYYLQGHRHRYLVKREDF